MPEEKPEVLALSFNFNTVISSLKEFYQKKGYEGLDFFPKAPELPIDLYCEGEVIPPEDEDEDEPQRKNRIFVIVCLAPQIYKRELDRLQSYQYYLSKYLSPIEYTMVLVIPHNSEIVEEQSYKVESYNECGFGLFRINDKAEIKEVYPGIPLRQRMVADFEKSDLSVSNPELKEHSKSVAKIFDLYLHEFAELVPLEAERRYIDRKVLDRCLELTRIRYKDDLQEMVNQFLSDKSANEYDFCKNTVEMLWKKYLDIEFKEILSVFEPILPEVVPSGHYRDHLLHQFQVFLTGTYAVDKLYDSFKTNYESPELSWLIAATTHDIAYPIQYYNQWTATVFNRLFSITENIGAIELKSHFIDGSFLECLGLLIERFFNCKLQDCEEGQRLATQNSLVRFFHKQSTEDRNHGVLQCLSLLKSPGCSTKKEIFVPSALSVALHHGIWKKLNEQGLLKKIAFANDPLTFILIFFDTIQEWGRPKPGIENSGDNLGESFYLKEFEYIPEESRIRVRLWTPRHLNNESIFIEKLNEIVGVSRFLQHDPKAKFRIELEDKEGNCSPYNMTGPST